MSKVEKIAFILEKEDSALHYNEITKKYNQLFQSDLSSKHINSLLSRHIVRNLNNSKFVRLSPGFYGLRDWLGDKENQYKEYFYKRKKVDYLDEYIAVFDSKLLPTFVTDSGVIEKRIDGSGLSAVCKPMHRRKAEETTSVIQLVSVFLICYKKQILSFTRTKALPEKRLRNTISINFGGHISYDEASDIFNLFDINDQNSLIARELHEELTITKSFTVEPIGYIHDNTTNMGLQHLGLLHLVELSDDKSFSISEKSFFINASFKSTNDVRKNSKPDFWTESLLNFLDNRNNKG